MDELEVLRDVYCIKFLKTSHGCTVFAEEPASELRHLIDRKPHFLVHVKVDPAPNHIPETTRTGVESVIEIDQKCVEIHGSSIL